MIEPYMIWIWLAIFIITLIVEALTQDLVSIWFSLGALVVIILSLFPGMPFWGEIIVFVIVSIITLILTRPIVKKMLKNQIRKTNADSLIGQVVLLKKDTMKDDYGEVKINDVIYQTVLADDDMEPIKEGEYVTIIAIKGNKLIIKKHK